MKLTLRKEQAIFVSAYTNKPDITQQRKPVAFIGHRGLGKTYAIIGTFLTAIGEFLGHKEIFKVRKDVESWNPNIVYCPPTKEEARRSFWPEFQLYSDTENWKHNNHSLTVKIPRPHLGDVITLYILPSKMYERMKGIKADLILIDEAQYAHPNVLEAASSAVKRKNGMIMLTGTALKGSFLHKEIKKMAKDPSIGDYFIIPASMTDHFTDEELAREREILGYNKYMQEYECVFHFDSEASFYAKKLDQLEQADPFYLKGSAGREPIVMGVDIGVGKGNAAWLAQVREGAIHIIGYYDNYLDIKDMAEEIKEDGLMPDIIYLPHDGSHGLQGQNMKKRSLYLNAFPNSHVCKENPKTQNKMLSINSVLAALPKLRWACDEPLEQFRGERVANHISVHQGYMKLKLHGRKVDSKTGEYLDVVDKRSGGDHTGDALDTLLTGLRVFGGEVTMDPGTKTDVQYNRKHGRGSSRTSKRGPGRSIGRRFGANS